MARYRIGNDFTLVWTINNKGEAFPLDGMDVHLFYTCERGRFEAVIRIEDTNKVVWDFFGSQQKVLGSYSLTLVVTQADGKRTITKDVCDAFTLVGKDCETNEGTNASGSEEIEVISENITTDLDVIRVSPIIPYIVKDENGVAYWYIDGENTGERATGESAYEYAVSKGYIGTEEDFARDLANCNDYVIRSFYMSDIYDHWNETQQENFSMQIREDRDLLEAIRNGKKIVLWDSPEHYGKYISLKSSAEDLIYLWFVDGTVSFGLYIDLEGNSASVYISSPYSDFVEKSLVATINGQSLINGGNIEIKPGSSYDDTEIKQELTELSAEIGKKQDTITDLENIRSGAAKGATAIQEVKTINGQSIVGSGNIEIQGGGGGGASSDKQGVIRQTQKWTQAADKGYDYVMQNIVRGAIPQANIDLFTSAGAVFNEGSGYFELNGLTDISYEEMSAIYNAGYKMVEGYWMNNIRTNIFRPCNVYNAGIAQLNGFVGMYANRNCTAEVFKFTEQEIYGVAIKNDMYGTYDGCIYLKTFGKGVFFGQDTNISDQAFGKCYSLETIYLRSLKKNVWFKDSARLSIASVLYMVANSAATSAIVITLHADAYARAMADTKIQAALEAHPNVSLASA